MIEIEKNVNIDKYTTFGIGGPADFLVKTRTKEQLIWALGWARKERIPFYVFGGGSNILVSDSGFRGLVIINKGGEFEFKGNLLRADGGSFTPLVSLKAREKGLSGLDFAVGIPGTVGGAVCGNAGAYGTSISEIFESCNFWEKGEIKTAKKEELNFSYRSSDFKAKPGRVILEVFLRLKSGGNLSAAEVKADTEKRSSDYGGANAGSYFKNISVDDLSKEQIGKVEDLITHGKVSIGKLVDSLGLKGKQIGGASISTYHGNVFLNNGGATAKEILELEKIVKEKAYLEYGIVLETEVVKAGF